MKHKEYVKSIMTRDSEGTHKLMYSRLYAKGLKTLLRNTAIILILR